MRPKIPTVLLYKVRTTLLSFVLCFVLCFVLPLALALSQTSLANSPKLPLESLQPVGQASLRVLWFNIYDATLFTSSGVFSEAQTPVALELVYKRKISRKKLINETEKQLKGKLDENTLSSGLQHLASIWPDINKKDVLTFYLETQELGHFYHNDDYLGSINTENFAQAFLNIWIGQDSQYPELAKQLKGFK